MRKGQSPNSYRQREYIEGNTVRKLETAPRRERERQQPEKKRKIDRATSANRERSMQLNPGYIVFLTLALVLTVGICVTYIGLQADAKNRMRNIASLENQALNLKTDNDAALKRIETSVDMEAIKTVAINELGMTYPSSEQINYFEVETNDYMNQYQDIPEH